MALSAGIVVIGGSAVPWLTPAARLEFADSPLEAAMLARLVAALLGALIIATGMRRAGRTGDRLMASSAGTVVCVLAVATLADGPHNFGFGAFIVLAGCLLALGAALLNSMEYETSTILRVIDGRPAPPGHRPNGSPRHRGDDDAGSQVGNARTRVHTSDGRS